MATAGEPAPLLRRHSTTRATPREQELRDSLASKEQRGCLASPVVGLASRFTRDRITQGSDFWTHAMNDPAAIDLPGSRPDGTRVIFEAKTIADGNETAQCRAAVAQLLEYQAGAGVAPAST
jgi:hypothetical protein